MTVKIRPPFWQKLAITVVVFAIIVAIVGYLIELSLTSSQFINQSCLHSLYYLFCWTQLGCAIYFVHQNLIYLILMMLLSICRMCVALFVQILLLPLSSRHRLLFVEYLLRHQVSHHHRVSRHLLHHHHLVHRHRRHQVSRHLHHCFIQ